MSSTRVPELAKVDARMPDRLMGSGRNLPADEREARQQRIILMDCGSWPRNCVSSVNKALRACRWP